MLIVELEKFGKAQLSAFLGGIMDFLIMVLAVEFFGLHYIFGIIIGGMSGAVINFGINHFWTFKNDGNLQESIVKFILVLLGSILLKSTLTYAFTEWCYIDYRLARIMADVLVCFGFNYTLQRLWVFKVA